MEPRVLTATLNPVVSEGVIAFQYESGVIEQSDEPMRNCRCRDRCSRRRWTHRGHAHRRRFSAYLGGPRQMGESQAGCEPDAFIRWAVAIDDLGETIWGTQDVSPQRINLTYAQPGNDH